MFVLFGITNQVNNTSIIFTTVDTSHDIKSFDRDTLKLLELQNRFAYYAVIFSSTISWWPIETYSLVIFCAIFITEQYL